MIQKRSKAKVSYDELLAENRHLKRTSNALGAWQVARDLVKYGAFVCIAWIGKDWVIALAGKETTANIGVDASVDAGLDVTVGVDQYLIPVLVALVLVFFLWANAERKLRQSTVLRLQSRIQSLEKLVDPGRTTSGLLPNGETRREDD